MGMRRPEDEIARQRSLMNWNWKAATLWQRLLGALLITAAASAFRVMFFGGLGRGTPYLLYYPATILAALYGGLAAGFLATTISAGLCFFWIQRGFMSPVESLAYVVFIIGCMAISSICEALRRAHQRTQLDHERFRLATRATNDLVWDRDLATNVLRWGENIQALFGYRREDLEPGIESWVRRIHPDDEERVTKSIRAAIDGGDLNWSDEYQFRCADSSYANIFDRGYVIRAAEGKPTRMIGAMQDITERKRAEEELVFERNKLAAAIESTAIGFVLCDPQGDHIVMNAVALRFHGFASSAEMHRRLGEYTDEWELRYPDGRIMPLEEWPMSRAIRGDYVHSYETCLLNVKTGYRPVGSYTARPVRNIDGEVTLIVMTLLDITQQKQAEEALRASEERFRIAAETANDVVYEWDLKQSVKWTSRIDELLGYKPGEFPRTLDGWASSVHPEDLEYVLAEVQAQLEGRTPYAVEYRVRRKDGVYRWWLARGKATPTPDGKPSRWIGSITDITERKQAEQVLAIRLRIANIFNTVHDEGMFNEVLNIVLDVMHSPFGVFGYIDETGALVVPTMTRQIWDKCQVPDKTIIFPHAAWGDSSWPRAIREKQANSSNEVSTNSPAGHVTVTRHINLPILFQGEVIGLFQVANKETDYTAADIQTLEGIAAQVAPLLQARIMRERAEQALRVSSEELQHKNAELERFLYAASHDLRSPVVTVRTFLGYLERDMADADAKRIAADMAFIRTATNKMAHLLDDLLEISRVGRLVGEPADVALRALVDNAIGVVGGRIAERGIEMHVSVGAIVLHGDRARLAEIYQNLIDNACKFMGDQKEPRIEIGIVGNNDETAFFVRDNGIGIEPHHQARVFELFEKLDPKAEGTGIGLALVRRIVELYGGRIWVESAGIGQGTCFYFTLPEAIQQANEGEES
jgi:PAS domain S-box-containing protein